MPPSTQPARARGSRAVIDLDESDMIRITRRSRPTARGNAPAKGTLRQYKMAGERLKEVFAEFAPDEIKAVHVQE